ncbi:FixH family protein [Allorhodopirellula solitaria]|uniref:FixH n=1 Tax=Allorhodopirellula solitaria TaxID=2527987 RepID=A0A5C5YJX9_9BACT|nr:FixH family protein [Allorhodopirellula solitaria]TWT75205.1 FixH [Allorhodopirellula solitaria]
MSSKSDDEIQSERKAKRFYIGLVLLLFAIQFTILGTALKLAIGDPALAVVPDYHQAALDWDAIHAASSAAAKQGWDVQIDVSDVADGRGLRAVDLNMSDDRGQPVTNLTVVGKVYHHADADRIERFEMQDVGGGRYLATPPMARPGLWQLELDIRNAGTPMTLSKTCEF